MSIGYYMCRMYTVYSQRGQYQWQPDHILLPAPADVSEDTQYTQFCDLEINGVDHIILPAGWVANHSCIDWQAAVAKRA